MGKGGVHSLVALLSATTWNGVVDKVLRCDIAKFGRKIELVLGRISAGLTWLNRMLFVEEDVL